MEAVKRSLSQQPVSIANSCERDIIRTILKETDSFISAAILPILAHQYITGKRAPITSETVYVIIKRRKSKVENNENNIIMSKFAFERMQAKDEVNDRWRNITIIVLIVLLVVTNAMWLIAWNQYDYIEDDYSVQVDGGSGVANYIGNDGDINNGKDYSAETNQSEGAS